MNREAVDKLARAILYEGYVLYPYRPSVKSRQRWTFGGLYPKQWSDEQSGSDAWTMQTECLVEVPAHAIDGAKVEVVAQFLHLLDRTIGELAAPVDQLPEPPELNFTKVNSLVIGQTQYSPWQEAVERRVEAGIFSLSQLLESPSKMTFSFPKTSTLEALRGHAGKIVAVIVRDQQAIEGDVEISCTAMEERLFKITVRVLNRAMIPGNSSRDDALMRSFASTHAILAIEGGQFISAIDPPEKWKTHAAGCSNIGAWPVLVGEASIETDMMLCSPIILYDYPRLAPESPGDLFDGTEIDEILTLRILTLTDEEKRAAAGNDERVRALLSRTETLARENLMNLHGVFRPVAPGEQSHG